MPARAHGHTGTDNPLFFSPCDCIPNYEPWRAFKKDLLAFGGRPDDHGWSFADVYLGMDDCGRHGTPLPAGANNDDRQTIRLRRKRRESHTFLIKHLSNRLVTDQLATAPTLGNGEVAYMQLRLQCRVLPNTADREDQKEAWRDVSIVRDVGVRENSIIDLDTLLDAKIADAGERFTSE